MAVNAINAKTVTGAALGGAALRALSAGDFVPGSRAEKGQHERLVEQAQKWVAQTFYGQLLKQMRNSPFKSELFSGGRGGEAFGGLFDQQLADRMSRGAGNKLVRSIVRRMEARSAYAQQQGLEGARRPAPEGQANPFEKVRVHVAASPGA